MTERDLLRKLVKSVRKMMGCPICFNEGFHDPPEFDHEHELKTILTEAETLLKRDNGKKTSN